MPSLPIHQYTRQELEDETQRLKTELFFQEDLLPHLEAQDKRSRTTKARIKSLQTQLRQIEAALQKGISKPPISVAALPVDFLIVTALEEERDAVLAKLPRHKQLPPSDVNIRTCYSSNLRTTFSDGSKSSYRIVVVPLLGMGRVQAVTATNDAIHQWHPRYVMLVGIAGGIAARDVKLGDILVSDQIVDYELQKITPKGPQIRWRVYGADPRLVGAAREFRRDWLKLVTTERPDDGKPVRYVGPIASGDKVVAFGRVLERYRRHWPALMGVEMEAAGVAAASFQAAEPPGFFMVRGVSDLADEQKSSSRVKKWRLYACDVAASYAIAMLKNGPVTLSPTVTVSQHT